MFALRLESAPDKHCTYRIYKGTALQPAEPVKSRKKLRSLLRQSANDWSKSGLASEPKSDFITDVCSELRARYSPPSKDASQDMAGAAMIAYHSGVWHGEIRRLSGKWVFSETSDPQWQLWDPEAIRGAQMIQFTTYQGNGSGPQLRWRHNVTLPTGEPFPIDTDEINIPKFRAILDLLSDGHAPAKNTVSKYNDKIGPGHGSYRWDGSKFTVRRDADGCEWVISNTVPIAGIVRPLTLGSDAYAYDS